MEYQTVDKLEGYNNLNHFGLKILQDTTSLFLSCKVSITVDPINDLQKYNINIFDNERRGFYPINDDYVVIIGRILDENKLISSIGLFLKKKGISEIGNFLTILEGAITNTLSSEYKNGFTRARALLGEELINRTICNYFSKVGRDYDYRQIKHLIFLFQKLRTTSFEGNYFSSGLILTKSHYDFKDDNRFGKIYNLKKEINLSNETQIDRRLWYLIDGKQSFFIANKSLIINQIFVLNEDYNNVNYIDSHTLAMSLKGVDILFKLENEKLFSIINSTDMEVSYIENQWKLRNYSYIRKLFYSHFKNEEIVENLLYYIIFCSKNSISSIIWLPKNLDKIDELLKGKNRLLRNAVSINDKSFSNQILRYFSSDGAAIIDKNGLLQYFGCIIDINKVKIEGVKGTGESAAGELAGNGMSIKISQDGTIKVFTNKRENPIII